MRRSTEGVRCSTDAATSAGVKLKATITFGGASMSSSDLICVLLVRSSRKAPGKRAKKGTKLAAKRVTGSSARLSQS